ncbi:MAG TPA: hypothetical protein DCO75_01085 [Fibrobacteres bacterium]|nr:hypothetical protein [Fibrobacterota bacterium]
MKKEVFNNGIYERAVAVLDMARTSAIRAVTKAMVIAYYEIGKMIILEEQKRLQRAEYGQNLINELSSKLTDKYGKGFSVTNIKQMRSFYVVYSKGQTVSDEFKLSWSHYLFLMRIDNAEERSFYEMETINSSWSLRELKRQFDSGLYERLSLSRDKSEVMKLAQSGMVVEKPKDILKDPYVLEFLGLPEEAHYSESEFNHYKID